MPNNQHFNVDKEIQDNLTSAKQRLSQQQKKTIQLRLAMVGNLHKV